MFLVLMCAGTIIVRVGIWWIWYYFDMPYLVQSWSDVSGSRVYSRLVIGSI